jgi:hypothetical protein
VHILEPEIIPDTEVRKPADLRAAAEAMFASAEFLHIFGDPPPATQGDLELARKVLLDQEPHTAIHTSAAAQHLQLLLSEYDRQVVKDAIQIRTFVTNRLLEEAQPGAKHSVRALELLGKITGVDLFTERSEVTIKNKTHEELEQAVREKLQRLRASKTEATDVKPRAIDPVQTARVVLDSLTAPETPGA